MLLRHCFEDEDTQGDFFASRLSLNPLPCCSSCLRNAETLKLRLNDCQQNLDPPSHYQTFLLNMHVLAHRECSFYFLFNVRTLHLFAWGTDTLKAHSGCDCQRIFQWMPTQAFHHMDTYPLGMALTLPIYFT